MAETTVEVQFFEMGLDDRILEAIARLGWSTPTLIQEKAIPYMLEGKDILARARTGSGKTGAFVIPTIHKILQKKLTANEQIVRALILAPSKELCKQISENITQLTVSCKREVRIVDVSSPVPVEAQKPLLIDQPDIVIGTPMRIMAHMNVGNLNLQKSLDTLIIDEADLMFAFEHEKDLQAILKSLPSIYQTFVTSATMCEDLRKLKKLVLHDPVTLNLQEPPLPLGTQLTQYVMKLEEFDKYVLVYALFRLNMIRGKTIIFVNSVDKGYKLRMFLGQFEIRSCVLNSEMPVASRCHIVDQFNLGKYDIVIASDEHTTEEADKKAKKGQAKGSKRRKDKESGVSRGIDFHCVANIINFDFPPDGDAYVHRVGRTARGDNQGTSLSLVSVREEETYTHVEARLKELAPGTESPIMSNFKFDMEQLDGFRYRARDAVKRCTSIAIKETRKQELRTELLNSAKLRSFFEANPRDLQLLRHDKGNHAMTLQPHLRNVPDYIVPEGLRHHSRLIKRRKGNRKAPKRLEVGTIGTSQTAGTSKISKAKAKFLKLKADPLKSMQFSGFIK